MTADATSKVDVLQVALVINIGFAIANTAGNSAIGVSAPKLLSVPYGLAFNPWLVARCRVKRRSRRADATGRGCGVEHEDPAGRGRSLRGR